MDTYTVPLMSYKCSLSFQFFQVLCNNTGKNGKMEIIGNKIVELKSNLKAF